SNQGGSTNEEITFTSEAAAGVYRGRVIRSVRSTQRPGRGRGPGGQVHNQILGKNLDVPLHRMAVAETVDEGRRPKRDRSSKSCSRGGQSRSLSWFHHPFEQILKEIPVRSFFTEAETIFCNSVGKMPS